MWGTGHIIRKLVGSTPILYGTGYLKSCPVRQLATFNPGVELLAVCYYNTWPAGLHERHEAQPKNVNDVAVLLASLHLL
jgi:hypothetical protein